MPDPRSALAAVIVAAGSGRRFDPQGQRKQYRPLRGVPLLAWSLAPFLAHPRIDSIAVVLPADDAETPPPWLRGLPIRLVAGGTERSDSVRAGLDALEPAERVLVHDGARPLVSNDLIDRVLDADPSIGIVPGLPVTDTLKEVGPHGEVLRTPDRTAYRRVQTPQAFPLPLLHELHRRARADRILTTDDAGLLERYGHTVRVVEGDVLNIKVTTPLDLAIAELLARQLPLPAL